MRDLSSIVARNELAATGKRAYRNTPAPTSNYRLMLQSGKLIDPEFSRYVDAFNYRALHNLIGARVIEVTH